jgi:ribonucleoside-diphosphate reductase alpha chain
VEACVSRTRLPDRRRHDVAEIEHGGFKLIVGAGRFEDGKLGEVFIDTHKTGTALDTLLRDAAILVSLCLQSGVSVTTIRAALAPNGPIAAVLDLVEEVTR